MVFRFLSRCPSVFGLLITLSVVIAACTGTSQPKGTSGPHGGVSATSQSEAVATPDAATPAMARTALPAPATVASGVQQPAASPTLTLLGRTDLGGAGFTGNVRALGGFAYVGSWGTAARCPALGVRVVDLADPSNPAVVATAAQFGGTSAEDVVPLRVNTPFFSGDLLAVGIQRCAAGSLAPGGLALVDVSDPRHPAALAFFDTGVGPRGVHELDVVVQGGRVLALLAVPYSERFRQGDFRIVDITDPWHPVQLSSWGAGAELGITEGVGCNRAVYAHSAHAGSDGARAYLSYWDAGVIILDMVDPAAPRFLARLFAPDAEGAVHSIDEMPGGLLLVTEEDDVFRTPRGLRIRVGTGGASEEFAACESDSGDSIDTVGTLTGGLVYAGDLCAAPAEALAGAVALVDDGGCGITAKARRARAAGARAVILTESGELATPRANSGDGGLPVVGVSREAGARLRALAQTGAATVTLPASRPWGGVSLWDVSDVARPVRRAVFRTENALRFPPPGPGYFTVHNPLAAGRFALASWYSDGIRVVDVADPDHPREITSFVPPATADPQGFFPTAPLVWGVALAGDLVLASDINGGLFVLRATGLVP
jgi:hypothetical protein